MEIYNLSTVAITAAGVCLLVIFVITGLIVWNNRNRVQVQTLQNIERKLKEGAILLGVQKEEQSKKDTGHRPEKSDKLDKSVSQAAQINDIEEEQRDEKLKEDSYSIGRSGKRYTKEELVEIIKN